jgi:heavy metal sensor kinase
MRSIRLLLVVYFLLLLGASLGAVSVFVYGSSTDTLRKSEVSKRKLLEKQHADRVKQAEAELDRQVLSYAEEVARRYRWYHEHFEVALPALFLGGATQLGCAAQAIGHLQAPFWFAERPLQPPLALLARRTIIPFELIDIGDDALFQGDRAQVLGYLQISDQDGKVVERSDSLNGKVLPLSASIRDDELFKESYETLALRPGAGLRMITIKRRLQFKLAIIPDPFVRLPGRFPKGPPRGGPRRGPGNAPPLQKLAYIQVAISTGRHDATLAGYRADLENGLAQVRAESDDTLAALRSHLWSISLCSFAALAFGGFWLVRLGLAPLNRLSEAVSRVSEKDFRLHVDDERLPRELQPIAERLKQTLDQLRRAFSREKQASADISHELRTPLAALLTTLDVGLRKPRSAEEYREMLVECRAAGQQMNHIVERLLALARLDAGVDHLRARDIDAAALALECAALVRPLAEARNVQLRVHHEGPAPLRTDPEKLREILTNLLHNAIQYNRPHGAIELAVARHNGEVKLAVQDTGIGIAAEARELIFERFYRADPSRNTDDMHTGLGLAIVKGYLDLMGGSIAVDSTPGVGSTFQVRLPAVPDRLAS